MNMKADMNFKKHKMLKIETVFKMVFNNQTQRVGLALLTCLSIGFAIHGNLVAQEKAPEYKVDKVMDKYLIPTLTGNESRQQKTDLRKKASAARKLIGDSRKTIEGSLESGSTGTQLMTEFFDGYIFPTMTQTDPAILSKIGERRREFLRDYLDSDYPAASRSYVINQVTIPKLSAIIRDNYHPGVRMNAVVLLGLLNDREGSSREVPVPSAQAWQTLTAMFQDQTLPDYVRVGALAGIQRHVDTNRYANGRGIDTNPIKTQCLAILAGTADGQKDWQEGLNYWMQRRAVQVLGSIGQAAGGVDVALLKVLNDKKNQYWLRLDAFVAISKLDPNLIPPANLDNVVNSSVRFVAFSLEAEAKELEEGVDDLVMINILYGDKDLKKSGTSDRRNSRDAPSRGNMGLGEGGGGGGGGRSGKAKEVPKVELPTYRLNDARKRVKAVLTIGRNMLKDRKDDTIGFYGAASAATKQKIDDLIKVITKLEVDSDTGITDLGAKPKTKEEEEAEEENPELRSVTQQMADIYRDGSKGLTSLIAGKKADDENMFSEDADKADAKDVKEEAPANPGK